MNKILNKKKWKYERNEIVKTTNTCTLITKKSMSLIKIGRPPACKIA
jgi:hypothetical protein